MYQITDDVIVSKFGVAASSEVDAETSLSQIKSETTFHANLAFDTSSNTLKNTHAAITTPIEVEELQQIFAIFFS